MAKKARVNQVPIAPFNLRDTGPLKTTDAYAKCGFKWFAANPTSSVETNPNRYTHDRDACPSCQAPVEWAMTAKVVTKTVENPGGLERYVYARCTANPETHRWAFRDMGKPTPPPEAPKEPKNKTTQPPTESKMPLIPDPTHPDRMLVVDAKPTTHAEVLPPEVTKMPTAEAAPSNAANPFAAFETWIEAKVGGRMTAAEEKLAALKPPEAVFSAEKLKALVEEAVNTLRAVVITVPTMPEVKFTGKAHPQLATLLKYVAAGERFFLLVGPAATGKSTLAGQAAEALQRAYTAVAITQTMQREDLLGCRAHNLTTGQVSYRGTPIVDAWEKHGVICLDEVDRGDPNTLCAFNAIEQGALYVPRAADEGGPLAKSDKAIVIATANTYGTGASRIYVGANQLDAAFVDRFRVIDVGYDRDLEIAVCGGDKVAMEAITYLTACRLRADKASVRRPLTTRFARRVCSDVRMSTASVMEAMRAEAKGWTATEIATVFQ